MITKQEKLKRFYQFLNIPLNEKWEENLQNDKKSWFYYLKSLNLITPTDFEAVYKHRKPLQANRILDSYMLNIDKVFLDRVPSREVCIDVGAGWGWITFWLLLSGSKRVYALGDPDRTHYIDRVLGIAKNMGLIPHEAECLFVPHFVGPGDLKYDDMIPANSVDLIFLNDTLEHINDRIRPTFFKASAYHLKPGGALISRCHHSESPKMFEKLKRHWARFEENTGIQQRMDFVAAHLPNLDAKTQASLADSIYGMDSIGAKEVLDAYAVNGVVPPRQNILPPMDLSCDVVEEGMTDRGRILPLIAAAGLEGHAYPFMLNHRRYAPFQGLARSMPGFFFGQHIGDHTIMYEARKPRA